MIYLQSRQPFCIDGQPFSATSTEAADIAIRTHYAAAGMPVEHMTFTPVRGNRVLVIVEYEQDADPTVLLMTTTKEAPQ